MQNHSSRPLKLRAEARLLGRSQANEVRIDFAQNFINSVVHHYFPDATPYFKVEHNELAQRIGKYAKTLSFDDATYWIGSIYTVMLPEDYRSQKGIYYTPPNITDRLLFLCEQSGIDWGKSRVLDPACGGGAFLAPVARRMQKALKGISSLKALEHIEENLSGFEQDFFAAWLSQTFLNIATADLSKKAGRPIRNLVNVRDSLKTPAGEYNTFDLIIGNPPYGKVKLSNKDRKKWSRSLFGHANYYGLFTDLAERLVCPQGLIAYVTPLSFLGGQYFKNLRALLSNEAPPICIEFIKDRNGVFADVLQETLLAIYKKEKNNKKELSVSYLQVQEQGKLIAVQGSAQKIPDEPTAPWILPKRLEEQEITSILHHFPFRLSHLGYKVSTGPLVWNRHKSRLFEKKRKNTIPVIWAESIHPSGNGHFKHKATRSLWYLPLNEKDPNIVQSRCVLLQRTSAPEQKRRLIAAELPEMFFNKNNRMITIENHVNMIKPIGKPLLSMRAITALLNSETIDRIFRCINGSTAVSAYELNNIPFPNPKDLAIIDNLLEKGSPQSTIEEYIKKLYGSILSSAA